MLGEAMNIASRSASDAQAESEAQLLASSIMNELHAGMAEMNNQSREPLESSSSIPWVYSVTIGDTDTAGLMSVEVLVEQDVEKQFRPVKYRLVRWIASQDTTASEEEDQEGDDGA